MATYPKNSYSDYTIGWICALPLEMAAAKAMLDEIHPPLPRNPSDDNIYTLGTLQGHNIVIACLPSGVYGLSSATTVAIRMTNTFQAIRFGVMVGIGGGVPSKYADIRLGDIVVSKPSGTFGGVVQYDYGKTIGSGRFQRTGSLNKPPPTLLAALADLEANHMIGLSQIPAHLGQMLTRYPAMSRIFSYPGPQQDVLFEAEHAHVNNPLDDNGTCRDCSASRVVPRPPRPSPDHPRIHYGLIASGNQVMRDGVTRDRVSRDLGGSGGILCFEMEAAGLMDHFPCLVIRESAIIRILTRTNSGRRTRRPWRRRTQRSCWPLFRRGRHRFRVTWLILACLSEIRESPGMMRLWRTGVEGLYRARQCRYAVSCRSILAQLNLSDC